MQSHILARRTVLAMRLPSFGMYKMATFTGRDSWEIDINVKKIHFVIETVSEDKYGPYRTTRYGNILSDSECRTMRIQIAGAQRAAAHLN